MKGNDSPYTAAMTGCGFLYDDFNRLLPLLMSSDSEVLLKEECDENNLLGIQSWKSRARTIAEFKRRFKAMPRFFWEEYHKLSEKMQQLAMFLVMLKTYRLYFDLQTDLVCGKWNVFSRVISSCDVLSKINDIACEDDFVDSWSESTRKKIASSFITLLRKVGLIDNMSAELCQPDYTDEELHFFIFIGEPWFLDAILLEPYRVEHIKSLNL